MMKKIFAAFLAALAISANAFYIRAEGYSAVLAEAGSGTVLIDEDGGKKYPCGSLSKLMTVFIAAEEINSGDIALTDTVTVSEHANSMQGAQIWLMPGDKITVEELLKGIIIGNANDAACALGEYIGGSEENFTAMMNRRADELGMSDTVYKNASGYLSGGDCTTADDTAKLLCRLSRCKSLTGIFTQRMEYICDGQVQLVTSNPKGVKYNGSLGFKTSFWEKKNKERSYFSAEGAERDGDIYVSAVLGGDSEDETAEKAFSLIDRGFAEYETVIPEVPAELPRKLRVRGGITAEIRISAENAGKVVVSKGSSDSIKCRTALPDYTYAPVKKGDTVGELLYFYNDKHIYTGQITAAGTSEVKDLKYCMVKMLKNLLKF